MQPKRHDILIGQRKLLLPAVITVALLLAISFPGSAQKTTTAPHPSGNTGKFGQPGSFIENKGPYSQ